MDEKTALEIYKNKEFLARGNRGFVYVSEYKKKKYLIKEKNPSSTALRTIENESEFNRKLNVIGIGPKFIYMNDSGKFLIRDYVKGVNIYEWIKDNSEKKDFKKNIIKIFLSIFEQAYKLDKAGINKMEMTHPHKDILITKNNEPIIIDFERCRISQKTKNVTQFSQFLVSGKMPVELNKLGIKFDKEKILKAAREYKMEPADNTLKMIKQLISL